LLIQDPVRDIAMAMQVLTYEQKTGRDCAADDSNAAQYMGELGVRGAVVREMKAQGLGATATRSLASGGRSSVYRVLEADSI
jgi:hypothetical protein